MKARMAMSMLVIILAAALVGGATMAIFTDEATNAGNSFAAGTVSVALGAQHVPVTVTNIAPGDIVTRSFTVTNDGTLELRFDVAAAATGTLFVGTTPAVVGGLGDDQNVVLKPGDSATVTFTVALPLAANNDYQGATGTVNFTISAEQTANN